MYDISFSHGYTCTYKGHLNSSCNISITFLKQEKENYIFSFSIQNVLSQISHIKDFKAVYLKWIECKEKCILHQGDCFKTIKRCCIKEFTHELMAVRKYDCSKLV